MPGGVAKRVARQETCQGPAHLGGSQPSEGFAFQLADPLPRQRQHAANFLKRAAVAAIEAETQADHLLLFAGQRPQGGFDSLVQLLPLQLLPGVLSARVREQPHIERLTVAFRLATAIQPDKRPLELREVEKPPRRQPCRLS